MKFEIEIKLRLNDDLGRIRRALRDLGFRVSKSRVHESNVLLDTANRSLRSHGKLIRVRRVGARTVLTYKGPSELGKYKKRHEIEVPLPDAGRARALAVDAGTGDGPARIVDVAGGGIKMGPFAVAVVSW